MVGSSLNGLDSIFVRLMSLRAKTERQWKSVPGFSGKEKTIEVLCGWELSFKSFTDSLHANQS